MEKRLILVLSAFTLLFTGCNKSEDVVGIREFSPFSGITFQNSFDIIFHTDTNYRIEMTGAKDMVDEIQFTWEGDTLKVGNRFKPKWLRPEDNKVKLDIYCDSLSKIIMEETCSSTSADPLRAGEIGIIVGSKLNIVDLEFDATTVYYWNVFPCSGTIRFSGNTDELKIWNTALMQVDALNMNAEYALVHNSSGGDCKVNTSFKLDYNITGDGNIYLSGNPSIIQEGDVSGEGDLILVN